MASSRAVTSLRVCQLAREACVQARPALTSCPVLSSCTVIGVKGASCTITRLHRLALKISMAADGSSMRNCPRSGAVKANF